MKDRHLHDYLSALYRAEVIVTGNKRFPVTFNDSRSPGEYKLNLLSLEIPVSLRLLEIQQRGRKMPNANRLVHESILDLESVFGRQDGHLTHAYLQIKTGEDVLDPAEIDPRLQKRIEEFLHVQRDSFLRQRGWFSGREAVIPSPFTLKLNESDTAELIACFLHTGIVESIHEKYMVKEFIDFSCRIWNLPLSEDYYTLVSHAMSRPNPTSLLDRLKKQLLDYIEEQEKKKK